MTVWETRMTATRTWIQTKTGEAVRYGSTRGRGGWWWDAVMISVIDPRCSLDAWSLFFLSLVLDQPDQCLFETVQDWPSSSPYSPYSAQAKKSEFPCCGLWCTPYGVFSYPVCTPSSVPCHADWTREGCWLLQPSIPYYILSIWARFSLDAKCRNCDYWCPSVLRNLHILLERTSWVRKIMISFFFSRPNQGAKTDKEVNSRTFI